MTSSRLLSPVIDQVVMGKVLAPWVCHRLGDKYTYLNEAHPEGLGIESSVTGLSRPSHGGPGVVGQGLTRIPTP